MMHAGERAPWKDSFVERLIQYIKIPLNPSAKTYERGSNYVILTITSLYMGHE